MARYSSLFAAQREEPAGKKDKAARNTARRFA
jgi:hypothetical protein